MTTQGGADHDQGGKPERGDERREYIRVPADCPVAFRILGSHRERKPRIGRDWLRCAPVPYVSYQSERRDRGFAHEGADDFEVRELLLALDWKLSLLIKNLVAQCHPEQFPHQGIMSEISGTGMKLLTEQPLVSGRVIELDVVLPVIPFHNLVLTGEVIQARRAAARGGKTPFEVGVAFCDLTETQRDHLVRYVLKQQMLLQRERRAA